MRDKGMTKKGSKSIRINKKERTTNSTYKKLVVHSINVALSSVSSSVLSGSFEFRNRQLLVAANR